MVKALNNGDKSREFDLVECSTCLLGNILSHEMVQEDTGGDIKDQATDVMIACDAHLSLISILIDGSTTDVAALSSTRAIHNLCAGNVKGQRHVVVAGGVEALLQRLKLTYSKGMRRNGESAAHDSILKEVPNSCFACRILVRSCTCIPGFYPYDFEIG